MKAPAFAYARPASLGEVFTLLAQHGDGARLLAGGQSLLATLNLRLSAPDILIDITGLPGMAGITIEKDTLRIGALATHRELEHSHAISHHLPLLAQAVPHVAHIAIRNVGTFGGSIAMADPAAEYPAVCVALDAQFVIAGAKGERRVAAREFFKGMYETALRPGEVLVAGEFRIRPEGYRSAFIELARRHGDYAIVGLAAQANCSDGKYSDVSLAFLGAGGEPVLARATAAALEGKAFGADTIALAQAALAKELDPPADLYSSSATKLHLARVITGRALATLATLAAAT